MNKMESSVQPTIVFVHGFYGSRLAERHSKSVIWIDFWEALFGSRRLNLPMPGLDRYPAMDIVATEVLDKITVIPLLYSEQAYGSTIDFLRTQGELVPFCYDWRVNLDQSASELRGLLKKLIAENKHVWVVAHSMGGLVSMQALRFEQNREDWSVLEKLKGVWISATPSWGATAGFRNMNSTIKLLPNRKIIDAVSYSSFESSYYLLPRGQADILLEGHQEKLGEIADQQSWISRPWGPLAVDGENLSEQEKQSFRSYALKWLQQSASFSARLHSDLKTRPQQIPKIHFARGSGMPTATKLHLSKDLRAWYWDYDLEKYVPGAKVSDLDTDGDGTVPMISSLPPRAWRELGAVESIEQLEHGAMMSDSKIHQQLARFLKPTN